MDKNMMSQSLRTLNILTPSLFPDTMADYQWKGTSKIRPTPAHHTLTTFFFCFVFAAFVDVWEITRADKTKRHRDKLWDAR